MIRRLLTLRHRLDRRLQPIQQSVPYPRRVLAVRAQGDLDLGLVVAGPDDAVEFDVVGFALAGLVADFSQLGEDVVDGDVAEHDGVFRDWVVG